MVRWRRSARWCAAVVAIIAALWELHRLLHQLPRARLATAWHDMPPAALAWSLAATAASFACLAGYEWFASQLILPGRIPARTALRAGAITHAISNTLGFHALTASVLRYGLYRPQALRKTEVARLMAVVAVCLGAGVIATMGLALAWLRAGVSGVAIAMVGVLLLAWLLSKATAHPGMSYTGPKVSTVRMLGLLMVGVLETAAALTALYVLLPADIGLTLVQFAPVFIGATTLGIVSHAPGGAGVFEAAILAMLPGHPAELLVSLLCYRTIYNLLPFTAFSVVAIIALQQQHRGLSSTVDKDEWLAAGEDTVRQGAICQPAGAHAGGWQR